METRRCIRLKNIRRNRGKVIIPDPVAVQSWFHIFPQDVEHSSAMRDYAIPSSTNPLACMSFEEYGCPCPDGKEDIGCIDVWPEAFSFSVRNSTWVVVMDRAVNIRLLGRFMVERLEETRSSCCCTSTVARGQKCSSRNYSKKISCQYSGHNVRFPDFQLAANAFRSLVMVAAWNVYCQCLYPYERSLSLTRAKTGS